MTKSRIGERKGRGQVISDGPRRRYYPGMCRVSFRINLVKPQSGCLAAEFEPTYLPNAPPKPAAWTTLAWSKCYESYKRFAETENWLRSCWVANKCGFEIGSTNCARGYVSRNLQDSFTDTNATPVFDENCAVYI